MTLRTQKLSASNAVVYAPRPVVEVVGRIVSRKREEMDDAVRSALLLREEEVGRTTSQGRGRI